jgi:uncharacterized protein YlxW (UPF0749 family)
LHSLRPRGSRGQLVAALLCAALGFAAVVQVRSNQEAGLTNLRQSDLVRILGDVSERSTRLQDEARELERARSELSSGAGSERAALAEIQRRAEVLGILAGTRSATGPGIVLTIPDPDGEVRADIILDAVQELRDAGAEAIQLGDARVVASTAFTDTASGIAVDGQELRPPYRLVAIGDAPTMAAALDIPGGVLEVLEARGSHAGVDQRPQVRVSALRPITEPSYARPAPEATNGSGG